MDIASFPSLIFCNTGSRSVFEDSTVCHNYFRPTYWDILLHCWYILAVDGKSVNSTSNVGKKPTWVQSVFSTVFQELLWLLKRVSCLVNFWAAVAGWWKSEVSYPVVLVALPPLSSLRNAAVQQYHSDTSSMAQRVSSASKMLQSKANVKLHTILSPWLQRRVYTL